MVGQVGLDPTVADTDHPIGFLVVVRPIEMVGLVVGPVLPKLVEEAVAAEIPIGWVVVLESPKVWVDSRPSSAQNTLEEDFQGEDNREQMVGG